MESRGIGILFVLIIVIASAMCSSVTDTRVRYAQDRYKGEDKNMGYCFDAAFDRKNGRLFVAAGNIGMHVFNIWEGNLDFIITIHDGGYYRNLEVSGDRVYIADARRGLVVFDVGKDIPIPIWKQGEAAGMGIHIEDDLVYLALGEAGLSIFDISKPDLPKLIGGCKTSGEAWDVWVNGKYAYVADLDKGLSVIDVSSASSPRKVAMVTWDETRPMAEIVRGEGGFVYVAAGKHGLVVIDVTDPIHPEVVGKYKSGPNGYGEGLCVRERLVYLANGNKEDPEENGIFVVDAHDPASLQVRGKCTFKGWVEGVCSAGNYIFLANTSAGVRSIDVRDPGNPRLADSFGPVK